MKKWKESFVQTTVQKKLIIVTLLSVNVGDIRDEKKVLAWFTDQGNLELADQIEEVNEKMLKKLIGSSAHVVAFFCKSNRFVE